MSDVINRQGLAPRFWEKPLEKLDADEWEALCDGCGLCCLLKLEDEETGKVHYTSLTCRLFDADTCRCTNYALRRQLVAGCVVLRPDTLESAVEWMPETCAYRRRYEDAPLPEWHPLLTGDPDSGARAGVGRFASLTPEYEVAEDDMLDHLVEGVL